VSQITIRALFDLLSVGEIFDPDSAPVITLLIDYGADVNLHKPHVKRSVLYDVAATGRKEIIPTLLQAGTRINVRSVDGVTPLIEAAESADADVVQLLLERGANVNLPGDEGRSAFDLTLRYVCMRNLTPVLSCVFIATALPQYAIFLLEFR
jgi:ankyrin repeat protein